MDKLCIPVSKVTSGGVAICLAASSDELRPKDAEDIGLASATVSGNLSESAQEYVFQGRVSGVFHRVCDRCLDEADTPFDVEVVRVFARGAEPAPTEALRGAEEDPDDYDEAGFVAFQGDEIDLRPVVWEEIVLAAPTKVLCKQDCAGLCPVCGANRNRAACTCRQTRTMGNTGLAGLAEFLPGLRPDHPKE